MADGSENCWGLDRDGLKTWLVRWWFHGGCFFVSALWEVVNVVTVLLFSVKCGEQSVRGTPNAGTVETSLLEV